MRLGTGPGEAGGSGRVLPSLGRRDGPSRAQERAWHRPGAGRAQAGTREAGGWAVTPLLWGQEPTVGTMPRREAPGHGSQTTKRNSQPRRQPSVPDGDLAKAAVSVPDSPCVGAQLCRTLHAPSPGRSEKEVLWVPLTCFMTKTLYKVERKRRGHRKGRKRRKNHFC